MDMRSMRSVCLSDSLSYLYVFLYLTNSVSICLAIQQLEGVSEREKYHN